MLKFVVYRTNIVHHSQPWRWRLVARNGKILADSGEAYARKGAALKAIYAILGMDERTEIEVIDPLKRHKVK